MELSNLVIISTILLLELVLAVPDQPPFTAQIVENLVKKEIAKKMPAAATDHKRKSMAGVHLKEATDAINKLVDESIVDRVQEAEKEVSQMLLRSIERHIQDAGKVLLKQDENTCRDKIESCEKLKEAGVCESSKDAMVINCPATCGFCGMLDNMKSAKNEGKKDEKEKEKEEVKPKEEQVQKAQNEDSKEEELAEKIEQEMEHVNSTPIANKDKKPKKEKFGKNHLKKHFSPKLKNSIPEEVRLLHQNMVDETFDHANLPLAVKTEPVELELIDGNKAYISTKNDSQEEGESNNEQKEESENEEQTKKQNQLEIEEKYKAEKLKEIKEQKVKEEKLKQEQLKEQKKKEEKLKLEKLRKLKKIKEEKERIEKERIEKERIEKERLEREAKERKKMEEKRIKEAEDRKKAQLAKKKKLARKLKQQQSSAQTLSGNDTASSGNGETETETIEQTDLQQQQQQEQQQQQTNDQIQQVQLTPSTEYAYGEPVYRYRQSFQPYEKPTTRINQDATKRNTDKKITTNRKLKDEIEVMVDKAFGELLL